MTSLFRYFALIYVVSCVLLTALLVSWHTQLSTQRQQTQLQQYADILKVSLRPVLWQKSAEQLANHLSELQYSASLPVAALGIYQASGEQLAMAGASALLPVQIDPSSRHYQQLQSQIGSMALQPLYTGVQATRHLDAFQPPDAYLLVLPEPVEHWQAVFRPLLASLLLLTLTFAAVFILYYRWQQEHLRLLSLFKTPEALQEVPTLPSELQPVQAAFVFAEQQQQQLVQQLKLQQIEQQQQQQRLQSARTQQQQLEQQTAALRQHMSVWLAHCQALWQRQEQLSVPVFQGLLRLHFLYGLFQFNRPELQDNSISLLSWLPEQFTLLQPLLSEDSSIDWLEGEHNSQYTLSFDENLLQAILQAMLLLAIRSDNLHRILFRVKLDATSEPVLVLHLSCDGNGLPSHLTYDAAHFATSKWQWRDIDLAFLHGLTALLPAELKIQSLEGLGSSIQLHIPVKLRSTPSSSRLGRLLVFDHDNERLMERLAGLNAVAMQLTTCTSVSELTDKLAHNAPDRLLLFLPAEPPSPIWQQLLQKYQGDLVIHAFAPEFFLTAWQEFIPCYATADYSLAILQQAPAFSVAKGGHKKLLVVDDNETNQAFVSVLLQHKPFELTAALTGQAVLALCKTEQFDLILLDISLPDISGVEVAQQLRQLPGYQNTPILAFTAHAMPDEIAQFKQAGMNDILLKPLEPVKFATLLARYRLLA